MVRSQICIANLRITQWHTGLEPEVYDANDLDTVKMFYVADHLGHWHVDKAEIILKDGTTRIHTPLKGMSLDFQLNVGINPNPVILEQHFGASDNQAIAGTG